MDTPWQLLRFGRRYHIFDKFGRKLTWYFIDFYTIKCYLLRPAESKIILQHTRRAKLAFNCVFQCNTLKA